MRCPPKTHKLSLKGIGGEEDTGDEETSLWAELHGLWSTRPCPGHGGDLATAGFIWHFLPSSQEIVHGCTRSSLQQPVLLPKWPRGLKTIIMSQFSTLGPQTRSKWSGSFSVVWMGTSCYGKAIPDDSEPGVTCHHLLLHFILCRHRP